MMCEERRELFELQPLPFFSFDFSCVIAQTGSQESHTHFPSQHRMAWPPTSATYWPIYMVEGFYDEWETYHERFKMEIRDNTTIVLNASFDMQLNAFNAMDTNGNGYISIPEFRTWMANARYGSTTPTMTTLDYDSIFASLDTGDPNAGNYGAFDGKLQFEEMQYILGVWVTWS